MKKEELETKTDVRESQSSRLSKLEELTEEIYELKKRCEALHYDSVEQSIWNRFEKIENTLEGLEHSIQLLSIRLDNLPDFDDNIKTQVTAQTKPLLDYQLQILDQQLESQSLNMKELLKRNRICTGILLTCSTLIVILGLTGLAQLMTDFISSVTVISHF